MLPASIPPITPNTAKKSPKATADRRIIVNALDVTSAATAQIAEMRISPASVCAALLRCLAVFVF